MAKKYILGLDGLRTVAILGVIFYHLTPFTLPGGFLGVNLFFIISGYLLTQKLMALTNAKAPLKPFIRETIGKRLKSTFKPLAYTLFLTVTVVTLLAPKLLQNITAMLLSSLAFVNNWFQISLGLSYFERHFGQSVFTHFWYLSALIQMIVIWSVVFFVVSKTIRNYKVMAVIATLGIVFSAVTMLLSFNLDNITRVYYGTDTRFFDFLIGAWVALVQHVLVVNMLNGRQAWYHKRFGGLTALIIILVMFVTVKDDNPLTYQFLLLVFDIVVGYLIAIGLNEQSIILGLLHNPLTRYVGSRSFDWYLWYFPVMITYQTLFINDDIWRVGMIFLILIVVSELFYQLCHRRDIYQIKKIVPFYRQLIVSIRQKKWQVSLLGVTKYMVFPIFIGVVLLTAPKGQAQSVALLQAQLAENEKLQQDGQTQSNQLQETQQGASETTQSVNTRQISFIGDSILLSAYTVMKNTFPNAQIDGKVSRQFYHGIDVASSMANQGKLYNEVVIFLGANSPFTKESATQFLDYLGKDRKIYWVTVRGTASWQLNVNEMMKELSKNYENLTLLDWASYSNTHSEWFLEDGVHPNTNGMEILANFFYKQLK